MTRPARGRRRPAGFGGGTIKAAPHDQLRLLDLQALDTHIAQLMHRKRSLPELADIARLEREQEALADDIVAAGTRVSDLQTAQRRAEADLEPVRERRVRNQHRIDSGAIADPKALRAMIEEVEHLGTRITTLEDAELEVMEELEAATALREVLGRQADEIAEKLAGHVRSRDLKVADVDVEGRELTRERRAVAAEIPADLLTLYDKLRASMGSGAAALEQRRCRGCQIEVNASDLGRFTAAAPDEVLRCEECGRILVRTARSGL
ncbi:zinc ribbon domain-containing protein [Auraticoccus monumenti]|uniref:Uncharacterized protein n=1 Tax=Auraticoccus monumenti TaxID=675864 RepID=A0A1G7E1H3_9ACTN|nr:C4-type zinc ribbon domain-containing protein [Auraticoccus monumenti]SDE57326.1 hypothetical protein SAMN04489747_3785 [Auraticoccus monumenti]